MLEKKAWLVWIFGGSHPFDQLVETLILTSLRDVMSEIEYLMHFIAREGVHSFAPKFAFGP